MFIEVKTWNNHGVCENKFMYAVWMTWIAVIIQNGILSIGFYFKIFFKSFLTYWFHWSVLQWHKNVLQWPYLRILEKQFEDKIFFFRIVIMQLNSEVWFKV